MQRNFSEEELLIAKSVDLTAVAKSLGYTVKRIGKYHTLKEMDSIRIYDRTHWFRWSRAEEKGSNGGSQIDFLKVFAGMSVKEAVFWLVDFAGYRVDDKVKFTKNLVVNADQKKKSHSERKRFILPLKAANNDRLYDYLMNERKISKTVVDYFVSLGLIYESSYYHDIVFLGNDSNKKPRFASLRGTQAGNSFKCDVAGNDKRYGFCVVNDNSTELIVFEAAIDLMSYVDLFEDYETNKLALGMTADVPLETFLEEHHHIKTIRFCLDNDKPGREAVDRYMEKYSSKGYKTIYYPACESYKDYNEWLVDLRSDNIILKELEKSR